MNDSYSAKRVLPASRAHQLLTVIGFSFVLFEIIFVSLYTDKFWFNWLMDWMGIPTVLIVLGISHFILLGLQSNFACRALEPIWKGRLPIAYTRWVSVDDVGFEYGTRKVEWDAIDRLTLTLFGNLEVYSNAFSGPVFKFPFGVTAPVEQKEFVERARNANAQLQINKRLEKRINSPIVKGQNFVQLIGASIMLVALFDLGYSSFWYLDLMKHLYLAESPTGQDELRQADAIRLHPLPISWVTSRFLNISSSAASLWQARALALQAQGRLDEALVDAKKASESSPDNFRFYLLQARILEAMHKTKDSNEAIQKAIEHHKDSILPRLYQVSNAEGAKQRTDAYKQTMTAFNESTFNDEPRWPPGGNSFLRETFYSDDVHFIFDRLFETGK